LVLALFAASLGVVVTIALALVAVLTGALTPAAGLVAAVFGSVIVTLGGFPFLALLVLFVIASVLATRYGFEEKQSQSLQEGRHGERGVPNVLSHIVVPTALVTVPLLAPRLLGVTELGFLYTSALAFGASDTFASEFGVLSGHARTLLSRKEVPPGTNGGISLAGELWALVGALTTAVVGAGIFFAFRTPLLNPIWSVGAVTLVGFVGCQVDSVLGETLENRGWLTKGGTNFLAMTVAVLLAAALLWAFGN
jgi:uncharacterized protein (TIGR00297 family)